LTFVGFVAVSVAWLSGRIAWWVTFVIWGAFVLTGLALQKLRRGRVDEVDLGPVVFSVVVWVRVRPARFNTSGFGYVRLLLGERTISTRARFVPRFFGKLNGINYTLRAADFEVGIAPSTFAARGLSRVTWSFSVGPGQGVWDKAVVLRGNHGQRQLELEFFRAEKVTREEVQRELVRAGARPAEKAIEG